MWGKKGGSELGRKRKSYIAFPSAVPCHVTVISISFLFLLIAFIYLSTISPIKTATITIYSGCCWSSSWCSRGCWSNFYCFSHTPCKYFCSAAPEWFRWKHLSNTYQLDIAFQKVYDKIIIGILTCMNQFESCLCIFPSVCGLINGANYSLLFSGKILFSTLEKVWNYTKWWLWCLIAGNCTFDT